MDTRVRGGCEHAVTTLEPGAGPDIPHLRSPSGALIASWHTQGLQAAGADIAGSLDAALDCHPGRICPLAERGLAEQELVVTGYAVAKSVEMLPPEGSLLVLRDQVTEDTPK